MATRRLAFVHVMKTAGSYVSRYLQEQVLGRHRILRFLNHRALVSWTAGLERDWNADELRSFLELPDARLFVHNHVDHWNRELVRAYRERGWFVFSFVRDPRDALCSFYHWRRGKEGDDGSTLDAFARAHVDCGGPWEIPEWWDELDWITPYSDAAFDRFLRRHLDCAHARKDPVNRSGNAGYAHYVEKGQITPETRRLLDASQQMVRFRTILGAASASAP